MSLEITRNFGILIDVSYNLTEDQKTILCQIVEQIRAKTLKQEFFVAWPSGGGCHINDYSGRPLALSPGVLSVFEAGGLMQCRLRIKQGHAGTSFQSRETGRDCTILQKAFDAVDQNFAAPDTSWLRFVQPLTDTTNFDKEIKARCLPVLATGGTDPKLWNSAVGALGPILEDRLRDIGGITDLTKVGVDLVNAVFGQTGTLAGSSRSRGEREGYRSVYAGTMGAIRNRYGHRLVDPTPETGGAIVVFVDLLLKMLEDLR